MSEPFIFMNTHAIEEGKLDDFKERLPSGSSCSRRTIPAFSTSASTERGRRGDGRPRQPDADSMEFLVRRMGQAAGPDVPLSVNTPLGGCSRLPEL